MRYIAKSPVTNMPVERDFDFRADKPLRMVFKKPLPTGVVVTQSRQ